MRRRERRSRCKLCARESLVGSDEVFNERVWGPATFAMMGGSITRGGRANARSGVSVFSTITPHTQRCRSPATVQEPRVRAARPGHHGCRLQPACGTVAAQARARSSRDMAGMRASWIEFRLRWAEGKRGPRSWQDQGRSSACPVDHWGCLFGTRRWAHDRRCDPRLSLLLPPPSLAYRAESISRTPILRSCSSLHASPPRRALCSSSIGCASSPLFILDSRHGFASACIFLRSPRPISCGQQLQSVAGSSLRLIDVDGPPPRKITAQSKPATRARGGASGG